MNRYTQLKRKLLGLSSVIMMIAWMGCSSPTRLASSHDVPAAKGTVKTEVSENGNTRVDLEVKHLANPRNISAQANTFVVWAAPRTGESPQNLGALRVDENLRGTIETTTPLRNFQLFVTAESSPNVDSPSGDKLLWTDVMG